MSNSYKKNNYLKVYTKGYKKTLRKSSRSKLKNIDTELIDGNMYRKFTERNAYLRQYSYMSEIEYDIKKNYFESIDCNYFNDFYKDKRNWYKAFKCK